MTKNPPLYMRNFGFQSLIWVIDIAKPNEPTYHAHYQQNSLVRVGRCALGFATRIGFLFFFLAFVR